MTAIFCSLQLNYNEICLFIETQKIDAPPSTFPISKFFSKNE